MDRRAAGKGLQPIGQVIYELHVGTFTPEGTWRAAAARARGAGADRHHRHRDDADRGVPGALRLGLRRRQPLRAGPYLRHARRSARLRRSRPRLRPRRRSSTSSTTTSGRTATTSPSSRPTTSPTSTPTTGDGRSTSRVRSRRARCSSQNARLLDRRVPLRRAAPRRDAGHQGRVGRVTSSPTSSRPRARRPARAPIFVVAENEPQDTHPGARSGARRLRRRTRCGTTMRIMRRWWR